MTGPYPGNEAGAEGALTKSETTYSIKDTGRVMGAVMLAGVIAGGLKAANWLSRTRRGALPGAVAWQELTLSDPGQELDL